MYISRMSLNTVRPEIMRLVSSPYHVHAAVENAFPPDAVRMNTRGRILWRIDSVPKSGSLLCLYVVSPDKPDFSHVVGQQDCSVSTSWESKDYTPVFDRVANGQMWQFRLKANPARKVHRDLGRKESPDIIGKIQGHVTVPQQINWLNTRSSSHGFDLAKDSGGFLIVDVSQRHTEKFAHAGQTVTVSTAVFDGVLTVTDADSFRQTLGFGLGRAKGFGCGLLTIAPIR